MFSTFTPAPVAWWPFDSWWDYERGMMVYKMPGDSAKAVKSV